MATEQTRAQTICPACNTELQPLIDERGAMSREFLAARGSCCENGCRNCPYAAATESCQQKTCRRCGARFECRGKDCWCHTIRLSAETLIRLEQTYSNCLCPDCLNNFAAT
jgi:hypothetical protein